ncbi:MAG: histidinol-phosphate transaminase [Sedimentisphaerales bacterium]|nr:histidinol-phosphate transaminase [Sedimentisphaerales bacterium]
MNFRFRDNIEEMAGYVPGQQPRDSSVIKINSNENPYPPSPKVFEALAKLDGEALRKYPPVFWNEFRRAAAQVHGVTEEMVVGGNGGDEILTMLVRCCCDKGRALAYPVPTYSLYPVLAKIQDAPVIEVPFAERGQIPAELAKVKTGLTILCNPNAPTGTQVEAEKVRQLARQLSGVLLIDEAYVDFAEHNCLGLLNDCNNVVILRSMSKGYSLAGMRFGYALGSQRIVEAMIKVKDSYNVNIAAQAAATAALLDQDYFLKNVRKIKNERKRLTTALRKLGFELSESQSNFLLAKITRPAAKEIYEKLVQRNILIRYFNLEGLEDKVRITVGSREQNDALLAVLEEII